jgi:eukaryotic-like serine/threonine-protein kinase
VSRAGADFAPVLSPAADAIAFASSREPATNAAIYNTTAGQLYMKLFRAAGDGDLLFTGDAGKTPTDWSRDGRHLAYTSRDDVWALPLPTSSGGQALQVTKTAFAEGGAVFSPDGQWIAYHSNESAAAQDVYIQSFPDGQDRHLVSVGGGSVPRWSSDGRELFYVSLNRRLMSVSVTRTASGLRLGKPVELFESSAFRHTPDYDVAAGNRFLLKMPLGEGENTSVAVIVNWTPVNQQPR